MTVGTRNDPNSCHCEERSDVAIHTHPVIARSAATWQSIFQAVPDARWIASPSARNDGGAARNDGGAARNDGGAARNDGGVGSQ